MSIKVIKEGNLLKIIESSQIIPDGANLTLYTAGDFSELANQPTSWEAAQLDSTFHADEEDWGTSLDALVVQKETK